MFCAPGHYFGSTAGIGSRVPVLRTLTHFQRYRGRRLRFSCFVLPDIFLVVPRMSGPVFMFCAPGHIFCVAECVGSRFHVLCAQTHFRRSRERRVSFSYFARPDSFSAVPSLSGPIFMFCAPGLVFGSTAGIRSRFHVLLARTRFRRYRGCRLWFSYFVLPDMSSEVPRASAPVFIFCAHGLIFGGTEGVGSHFHILRARTHFRWKPGCQVPFSYFAHPNSISAYRAYSVSFSCFALPDMFLAVPRAFDLIFLFCSPRLVFGGTEGIGSSFQVLHAQTDFRWYRGRRVPFSCFARPNSFSTEIRVPGAVFMFCAPGVISRGTEGVM
jgi:hypothetical protein